MCEEYMRVCSKCNENKPFSEFYANKSRVDRQCKRCTKARIKEYAEKNKDTIRITRAKYVEKNKTAIHERRVKYYDEHKEVAKIQRKEHYKKNKELTIATQKEYNEKNRGAISDKRKEYYERNRTSLSLKQKEYYEKNKSIINTRNKEYREKNHASIAAKKKEYINNRLKTDLTFKFVHSLRTRLRLAIKKKTKAGSAVKLLGCSVEEARKHIESTFQPSMTWENHGRYTWNIDHVIPLASFDLTDPEQLAKACHYTNLQALPAKENLSKGAKILTYEE